MEGGAELNIHILAYTQTHTLSPYLCYYKYRHKYHHFLSLTQLMIKTPKRHQKTRHLPSTSVCCGKRKNRFWAQLVCRKTVADGRKTKPEFDSGETCQVIRHSIKHTQEELKVSFTLNTEMWRFYFPAPFKKQIPNLHHAWDTECGQMSWTRRNRFNSGWMGTWWKRGRFSVCPKTEQNVTSDTCRGKQAKSCLP